jgi:hypothetical protein
MAAPTFQTAAGCLLVPVKQANSRYTCGIAPADRRGLQPRKAKSPALHEGGLTPTGIAQLMRGDIHFSPEDSAIIDRVIGRLRRCVQAC